MQQVILLNQLIQCEAFYTTSLMFNFTHKYKWTNCTQVYFFYISQIEPKSDKIYIWLQLLHLQQINIYSPVHSLKL